MLVSVPLALWSPTYFHPVYNGVAAAYVVLLLIGLSFYSIRTLRTALTGPAARKNEEYYRSTKRLMNAIRMLQFFGLLGILIIVLFLPFRPAYSYPVLDITADGLLRAVELCALGIVLFVMGRGGQDQARVKPLNSSAESKASNATMGSQKAQQQGSKQASSNTTDQQDTSMLLKSPKASQLSPDMSSNNRLLSSANASSMVSGKAVFVSVRSKSAQPS